MSVGVRVVTPSAAPDPDLLRTLLGEAPLPVPHCDAPALMIDGRFHTAACRWLQYKYNYRPVEKSIVAHARRLGAWIQYLRTERHLTNPDDRHSDVFEATEADLVAYYRARQYDAATQVSSTTWQAQRSTIKQFHEYLLRTYGTPMPFDLERINLPSGRTVHAVVGLRPRRRTGSRGTPITPGFAELLIQAALRIDRDGVQTDSRTADRDAAFISLGLGTGMRRETLTGITTYEIPARTRACFTTIRVPDFITKNDAGGEAIVFAHRLELVHNYLDGQRAEAIADGRRYHPPDAISIVNANSDTWTGQVEGRSLTRRWAETNDLVRRQLVNPDGSSPLAWLDPRTGNPIGYDSCGRITADARTWARANLNPDFPIRFRTHDLRHTYATHLTVSIFRGAVAPHMASGAADAYVTTRLADAVELAKMSLGHASEDSTRLYNMHAYQFLDIATDEFTGGR